MPVFAQAASHDAGADFIHQTPPCLGHKPSLCPTLSTEDGEKDSHTLPSPPEGAALSVGDGGEGVLCLQPYF